MDVGRLLLVPKMKKSSILAKYIGKDVETGLKCLQELTTFLKYHMPLRNIKTCCLHHLGLTNRNDVFITLNSIIPYKK